MSAPATVRADQGRFRRGRQATWRSSRSRLVRRPTPALDTYADRFSSDKPRSRHPWRSRPRNRTHPAFDRFLRSAVDPRHAWMNLHRNRIFRIGIPKHPRMAWIYRVDQGRHLPTAAEVCRRRGGSGCGGVSRMDAATELTWVRALCLRSTASQAPERTAASGWAGPRSGVYGVSRNRTHPAIPQETRFCSGSGS